MVPETDLLMKALMTEMHSPDFRDKTIEGRPQKQTNLLTGYTNVPTPGDQGS